MMASNTWRSHFQLPETRPHWQWAEEFVFIKNSPLGKKFNSELCPWLREPIQDMTDNRYREATAMCCVQGSKTTLLQVIALRAMRFDPAPMFITCQTNDDAKEFAVETFNFSLKAIPELEAKLPKDRAKQSICNVSLPDMFLKIQGANKSNLQSKPVRWILNDEVYLWKRGLLDEARKRGTRFWNRHVCNFSTAGDVGCDLDLAFEAGDKREWHHKCPECGVLNNPKWERIRWPKDESVRTSSGDWDFVKLKAATRFECEHCKAMIPHTERNHRLMNAGGAYVAMNPNPTPGVISFHWNALCLNPATLSWGDLAVEWVKAEDEFKKGNEAPRKEFITKRLAESYEANRYAVYTKLPMVKLGSRPDEAFRFMTVDVQETEFWAVIRGWSKTGESWAIWAGKLLSYDEIEAKAKAENVPAACVFLDSSFDTRKVYLECAKRNELVTVKGRGDWLGWKALNGEAEARKSFVYKPEKGRARLLPYSFPPKYVDPMLGEGPTRKYAKMYLWSNIAIKDILVRLRDKKGASWVGYEGIPEDWHKHMFSERRVRFYKNGQEIFKFEPIGKRPNHLWDCECMQVVAACMAGVIGGELEADVQSQSQPEKESAELTRAQ